MEPLEIALCITDLEVGGAERCLAELAARLDRQRFSPVVYCLGPRPRQERAASAAALESADVEVCYLDARRRRDAGRVLQDLSRLLAARRPRLVQTFLFHAGMLGRIAARRAGVEQVVCGIRVAERWRPWRLWADRLTDRLVDRHVCVSRSVARFACRRGGLPAEKLIVIANGVDPQAFPAPSQADLRLFGVPGGSRVVTYVGRLNQQKGVAWLIRSAPEWLQRLPDCHLLLVGEGPQRAKLTRLCRRAGIAGRVHFAGWRPDVPEILAASDLLVLPSAWEGMPNVVLEAMASRLPVVATEAEGIEELLGSIRSEQTARYGDSQAFAQKIVGFLTDSSVAARVGAENRRRAEDQFGYRRMVNAYQRLWESLARP